MNKIINILRKRIFIFIMTSVIITGLSITAVMAFNKPVYSGIDIIITPPAGRTPRPTASWDDYPIPVPSGPVGSLPYSYSDIYIAGNFTGETIKAIYSDGTVLEVEGSGYIYDKTLNKQNIALVNSYGNLWLIGKNGRNQIGSNINNAYISDSGEYIYFTYNNNNLLIRYDNNIVDTRIIYNFSDNESITDFAISPDGKSIVCTRGNVTYGMIVNETGDAEVYNYSDIIKVLAVTNNLSLVYGYNVNNELICVDSENRTRKLSASSKTGNLYFSNTRKNVIYLENNEYCLFDGNETKVIFGESDIMLLENEKLMKNISDNVYLVNKADFSYCYFGNEKLTYMLRSSQNANVIAEYKLNFIDDNTSIYYYIKNDYLYYYNEKYFMEAIQCMKVKEDYRILKVFNDSAIYYINSQNKLCFWNGTEIEINIEQPDIDNMSFSSVGNMYSNNTAYFVEKGKGVKIYANSEEIKTVGWTDDTIEMKLEQTSAGIILYWTENINDSKHNNLKLYLLNGISEVYLGTQYVNK